MESRCPACGDKGFIGADLVCASCHTRLEYAAPGRLEVEKEHLECRSCGRANPRGQSRCEGCRARLQETCPLCRGLHPVGLTHCPRRGLEWPRRRRSGLWAASFILGGLLLGGVGTLMSRVAPQPNPVLATSSGPRVDVAFVLDTTGSMEDEIDVVKSQIRSMMARVQSGQPRPQVRFALVSYRDRGDEYVTRVQSFTTDIEAFERSLAEVRAEGGGDVPEAVNQALHAANTELDWDPSQNTRKLIFLIGDAGPHTDYAGDVDYRTEAAQAVRAGIKIHVWGCSGITDGGDSEFQQIAAIGHGDFQYLTYCQPVVRRDGTTGYVLFQGAQAYEAPEAVDWKQGADRLGSHETRAVGGCKVDRSGLDLGGAYKARSGSHLENNLDRVLTEQVMDEAQAAGTRY